jgi:hypothetical protein
VNAGRRQFETCGVQKVRHSAISLVRLQQEKKRFETFTFYGEENVGGNFKKNSILKHDLPINHTWECNPARTLYFSLNFVYKTCLLNVHSYNSQIPIYELLLITPMQPTIFKEMLIVMRL